MRDRCTYQREIDELYSVFVIEMLYNDRLVYGLTNRGWYERGFCFPKGEALAAAEVWDGEGDPPGPWIKEVGTNRYGPGSPGGEGVR